MTEDKIEIRCIVDRATRDLLVKAAEKETGNSSKFSEYAGSVLAASVQK